METLPDGVSRYAESPVFSESSIPANLRRLHRTRAGIWAKIVVLEGKLLYRVLEPEIREAELSPETVGVAGPGVPHEVEPVGKVRFLLEFYR